MIAIIDYGVGNLFSLKSSFAAIGADTVVTGDPAVIRGAEKLVLPGVGAFGDAAALLRRNGLDKLVKEEASGGKPLLGICLGMQLLFDRGEEVRRCAGLGLVGGQVVRIPTACKLPHIGWNSLTFPNPSPLFAGLDEGIYVYFVHSYCGIAADAADVLALTDYGVPVTAAVGLESGTVDPEEDYGQEGLSWQKDSSWGDYYITTLHEYDPSILENALICSDNIYFAKAALKIGAENMQEYLDKLGFNEAVPFEINMSASKYSNGETIGTEIQLADSGYGQGQILVNPLHLACIYTAFRNEGNMVKPYLIYQEDAQPQQWISGAISTDTADRVLEGLKGVVNNSEGTGYAVRREDVVLAGKTGTAEIKDSKEDTTGTELGWFAVFSAGEDEENPILIVSMVEDVKERGGSGYVVEKVSQVLDVWFRKEYQGGKAAEGEAP